MKAMLLLLLSCAAATAAADTAPLREARGPKLVQPADLDRYWLLDTKSQRALPNRDAAGAAPGCATARFMIHSGGDTMDVVSVRSQPEGKYDKGLAKFLERAHFNVSPENAEADAVHTYMTLVWGAADDAARDVLAQPCAFDGVD